MTRRFSLITIVCLLWSCEATKMDNSYSAQLFSEVPAESSGLQFSNDLTVDLSTKFNLLDFDYFYNGAGVGVIDINNDGLEDVVLTGNMVQNKLFLNKGDLTFEDISEQSGINIGKAWSNGVSIADVNSDGFSDIYISQGGPHEESKRKNLLFINNGDLTFSEKASEYGLADAGISTQSAFFDMDKDGDLDCFVMNESILYGYDPVAFLRRLASNENDSRMSLSRLYRNDGGTFTDVGIESGISKPSFGLGLAVADINGDSNLDIYVANDYYLPDAMYINQGDGTFKDEIKKRTQQISMFGMGVDIEDIDQDGYNDIFVLDMAANDHVRSKTLMASMDVRQFDMLVNKLRFHHQYMFNSLMVNKGDNTFKNLSQLAGIAKSDWSWAVLIQDYDLDGNKDVFITNGYRKYGLDNDFKLDVIEAKQKYNGRVPLNVKQELYASIPEGKLPNLMYSNKGGLELQNATEDWGFNSPSFSNGAAHADFDNDGDLDLIINNIDQQAMLYENNAVQIGNNFLKIKFNNDPESSFARVTAVSNSGKKFIGESKRVRGYRSSVTPEIILGLGDESEISTLKIEWADGTVQTQENVGINQTILVSKNNAIANKDDEINPVFTTASNATFGLNYFHQENSFDDFEKEILLPMRQSTLGPQLAVFDANNDGNEDVIVGGSSGFATSLFIQKESKFTKKEISAFSRDDIYEDAHITPIDIDFDGDHDLLITSGGNAFEQGQGYYQNRLYLNDGKGGFTRSVQPELENSDVHTSKALSLDIDGDGKMELFIANRILPQKYPVHAPADIYSWSDKFLKLETDKYCDGCEAFGIINDAVVTDYDGDGDQDIIAVGEWSGIGLFENKNGKLELQNDLLDQTGWWYSILETDANQDGRPDYIIGNLGLNSKYKATAEKPFKIFASDFDENGSHDVVLSNKYKDEYVPLRGKECSSQQMPFIKEKYPSYEGFANASLIDVYGSKIDDAYEREVNDFKSIVLINNPSGFEIKPLPIEAQEFPILTSIEMDVNQDGVKDILIAGNIYQTEVETPRLDSGSGLVLLANATGNYQAMSLNKSGLNVTGDVKSLVRITLENDTQILIAGKNQGLLQIIKFQQ